MTMPLEEIAGWPEAEVESVVSLLSAIVNSAEDAIISKTLDGIITYWNRGAESIFGYTAVEAIGKSVRLIIPPERESEEDHILAKIRSGERIEHFDTVRITKDGRRLDMSITVSPLKNAKGVVIGASKIARDVTERKQLEREREIVRQQLIEAIAARDDFIAVAAHELRNPLNVLMLVWELLERVAGFSSKSGELRNLFEKSRAQIERLAALIDRLLDVARVRAGTLDLYRESFDLSALVREIINRFKLEDSAIPIVLELEAHIQGTWDRLRLDQVITNLVSNALKYGKEKPIHVATSRANDYALIKVQDEGPGLSSDELNRIFDRFEHPRSRSAKRGLGLGLWITKQITEAHGGTVEVESKSGKGSTFFVRLPIEHT
jgi:PAS domain S-box-containing protein